jgi:hypothetical protein
MSEISEELLNLEAELETLLSGNPHVSDARFLQNLCQLLRDYPQLLDYALEIPPKDSQSFLLLVLERVFSYTLSYRHPSYKPYYPQTDGESESVAKVLDLHFPELREVLAQVFQELGSSIKVSKALGGPSVQPKGQPQAVSPSPKKVVHKHHLAVLEDPGIHEEPLQALWVPSTTQFYEYPEELHSSFPNWAKGVISSMQRTLGLYYYLKKSRFLTRMTAQETRVQPHHKIVHCLMGSEFYWLFNKREVDLGRSIPSKRVIELVQGFLYSLSDLFMHLYPNDHPIHKDHSEGKFSSWQFQRIRGVRGAPKVLGAYEDDYSEFLVDCTSLSISIKRHVVKHLMRKDVKKEEDKQEAKEHRPLPVVIHPDPGIDENLLWVLYTNRKKAIDEAWPTSLGKERPIWARGILSDMRASITLYTEFKRIRTRTKRFDLIHLQPHHNLVKFLISAEYFWSYNLREIRIEDGKTPSEIKEVHQSLIYEITEAFRSLLPSEHPARKGIPVEQTTNWQVESVRGSGGAPRIVFSIDILEKKYLVDCTTSVISLKELSQEEVLRAEGKTEEKHKVTFIDETEDEQLPLVEYPDRGADEQLLWFLYTHKTKSPQGWKEELSDSYPIWARGVLKTMVACQTLFQEFHCNKRRTRNYESVYLQPHHDLIKFLVSSEYFWQYNIREVSTPEGMGVQEFRDVQQQHLYEVCNAFLELLPARHPARAIKRRERENWRAERIRGSGGASKVIWKMTLSEKEYLVDCTTSMVSIREMHDGVVRNF